MIRAVVYVYFDKEGVLREFAKQTLRELTSFFDHSVVVVNGGLKEEGESFIRSLGANLIVRDNEGYAFQAYKVGIDSFLLDEFKTLDELILCNSSVYGPVFPLCNLFSEMESRGCDFWGITQWCNSTPFPDHIQSYFIAFSRKVLCSESFKNYWNSLPVIKTWDDAVKLVETRLTEYFSKSGFSWDTYIPGRYYSKRWSNPIYVYADELLKWKAPFVKRKVFSDEKVYREKLIDSFGRQSREALNKIKELSSYDVNLIYSDLCETGNQAFVKQNLGNTYVIPSEYKVPRNANVAENQGRVALVIFVYFEDLIDECCKYILSMPDDSDKYIVSCKKELLEQYELKIKDKVKNLKLRIQKNRGRSEAAYFVSCRDVLLKYEYICCVHDKKMANAIGVLGESMMKHNFDSLLATKSYVKNVLSVFENNKNIGLLMPATPYFVGTYESLATSPVGKNVATCNNVLKNLSINLKADEFLNFPVGGMFWVRKEAISPLFRKQWALDDFPPEPLPIDGTINHALERVIPLVAQEAGFMTGYVIPDFCIGNYYEGLEYRLKQLLRDKYSREHYLRTRFPKISEKCHAIRDYFRKIRRK